MAMNQLDWDAGLSEEKDHWVSVGSTVKEVTRFLRITQSELADRLHLSRPTLSSRFQGTTRWEPWEIAAIARGCGLPKAVMHGPPMEAIRWILDHPEETMTNGRIRCSLPSLLAGARFSENRIAPGDEAA